MFTDNVQNLADEKGISIHKMAKDLGMSSGAFSAWKRRNTIPNAEIISKIADYFNVTTDYLLGRTDKKEKPTANDDEHSQLTNEVFTLFSSLPPEKKKQVLDYMKYLADSK